jgi:hypothetical protein
MCNEITIDPSIHRSIGHGAATVYEGHVADLEDGHRRGSTGGVTYG